MKYLALLFTVCLTACSSLLTSNENIQYFYVLNPVPEIITTTPAPVRLNVQRPIIPGWLDTDHIILRRAQNQLDYYAEARWVGNAGDMLSAVIMQSLENNHVVRDIFYQSTEIYADYLLVIEVVNFQAEYAPSETDPVVNVTLNAKLISVADNRIHSRVVIQNEVAASQNHMRNIVQAFDTAVELSMEELVEYTAISLK